MWRPVIVLALSGCAAIQADNRWNELCGQLNPMLGKKSKVAVIHALGVPSSCTFAEGHEFCLWNLDEGTRNIVINGKYAGSVDRFDRITTEFNKKGILIDWDAKIQR